MRGKLPKKQKKIKRQKVYHSSSEDEDDGGARDAPKDFAPVSLESSEGEQEEHRPMKAQPKLKAKLATPAKSAQSALVLLDKNAREQVPSEEEDSEQVDSEADDADSDDESISDASSISETSTNNPARRVRKRNDPEAFATSMSKILNTKLTSQKRTEPILSRSKSAQETNKSLSDHRLTQKAHRQLLAEKKAAQEKGRVKDVLGLNDPGVSTAATTAKEKELRRTAQKGVIKLFNAVRAAQVKGEQAEKEAREARMVGMGKRDEKVKEMSKQGFLDMIAGGAKQKEGSVDA